MNNMEERTVTIPTDEYKELIRQSVKLQMISEYLYHAEYISTSTIKELLGIYENKESEE